MDGSAVFIAFSASNSAGVVGTLLARVEFDPVADDDVGCLLDEAGPGELQAERTRASTIAGTAGLRSIPNKGTPCRETGRARRDHPATKKQGAAAGSISRNNCLTAGDVPPRKINAGRTSGPARDHDVRLANELPLRALVRDTLARDTQRRKRKRL